MPVLASVHPFLEPEGVVEPCQCAGWFLSAMQDFLAFLPLNFPTREFQLWLGGLGSVPVGPISFPEFGGCSAHPLRIQRGRTRAVTQTSRPFLLIAVLKQTQRLHFF